MTRESLPAAVARIATRSDASRRKRAEQISDLIRESTSRRWVGIYDVGEEEIANLAWSGPEAPAHLRFPRNRGLTGVAVASRRTVISNDVARDPRYLTALEATGAEMIVPVVLGGGRVVGTLDVEDSRPGAFNRRDAHLFEALAEAIQPLYGC